MSKFTTTTVRVEPVIHPFATGAGGHAEVHMTVPPGYTLLSVSESQATNENTAESGALTGVSVNDSGDMQVMWAFYDAATAPEDNVFAVVVAVFYRS